MSQVHLRYLTYLRRLQLFPVKDTNTVQSDYFVYKISNNLD
jgi:hypothetical protein